MTLLPSTIAAKRTTKAPGPCLTGTDALVDKLRVVHPTHAVRPRGGGWRSSHPPSPRNERRGAWPVLDRHRRLGGQAARCPPYVCRKTL